jgi:hypothetical protein
MSRNAGFAVNANLSFDSAFRASMYQAATQIASWAVAAAFVFAMASRGVMLFLATVSGPKAAKAAGAHKAQQIEQENPIFCSASTKTGAFVTCVSDLAEVRRRHAERLSEQGVSDVPIAISEPTPFKSQPALGYVP